MPAFISGLFFPENKPGWSNFIWVHRNWFLKWSNDFWCKLKLIMSFINLKVFYPTFLHQILLNAHNFSKCCHCGDTTVVKMWGKKLLRFIKDILLWGKNRAQMTLPHIWEPNPLQKWFFFNFFKINFKAIYGIQTLSGGVWDLKLSLEAF